MNILLTCDPHYPVPPDTYGGVERIVAGLLVELRGRGHRIGLVAHPNSSVAVDYFRKFPYPWPKTARHRAGNTAALLQAAREFSPSVIHSFSRLLYLAPLLFRGTPKVQSYQRFPGGRQIPFAASLAGSSLVYTGCSAFIADMGRRHGGNWLAIPNFVNTDFYPFSPAVSPNAPLVFLSRIEHEKGAHVAIEVAKKTGRRLLVAGNYAEAGPQRQYWDERIKPELGRNQIEYVGPVDDTVKRELLGSAAAMIVPIQWDEPFGIVFAEALACGTPVISCPRGALPEIVRDGIEGFHVRDADEACRAVRDIERIDRGQCRRRAEEAFSTPVVATRYEALYRSFPVRS